MEQIKHSVRIYPHRAPRGRRVRRVPDGVGQLPDGRGRHPVLLGRGSGDGVVYGGLAPEPALAMGPADALGDVDAGLSGVAGLARVDNGALPNGMLLGRRSVIVVARPLAGRVLLGGGARAAVRVGLAVVAGRCGLGACGLRGGGVAVLARGVAGLGLLQLLHGGDGVDIHSGGGG